MRPLKISINSLKSKSEWSNSKHVAQWFKTIEEYANPFIGNKFLDEIETEDIKQMFILNQNIVQDSHLAIVIDNSLPRLKLPFIAQTK